jgi:hypothetical protein
MIRRALIVVLSLGVFALAQGACSNDDTVHDTPADSGTSPGNDSGGGGGGDGGGGGTDGATGDDCVKDPKTHEDLLNACTDAVKIDKQPKLPLMLADGGLPPLP